MQNQKKQKHPAEDSSSLSCFWLRPDCGIISEFLSLQNHHDFMRGNCALAQYLPSALAQRKIDDRRRQRAARWPPSMISGMRSPIWSRTQAAWVHSDAPCRLAAVAVIGKPNRSTTARAMGASGTRRATFPVLAVDRRGSLVPARTMMVSGPGQKRSASLSSLGSESRASS